GKKYGSTLPKHGSTGETEQEKIDIAFRVIADHIRALSFAIADGIIPSNDGRGYVLRRILRRAVRYGRTLDFHDPFFFKLVDVVAKTMGGVFPEVRAKQKTIQETIRREEESFNKTLDKGIELFESEVGTGVSKISGAFAFRLYDEQGFPLDLTELMARERGLTVDIAGFENLMDQQRQRARKAQKKETITVEADELKSSPTNFLGYDHDHTGADVEKIVDFVEKCGVVLNNSVCYAEMGGQVGDTGEISGSGRHWKIANTQKSGATFIHVIEAKDAPAVGEHVTVKIDIPRRRAIERHHSVTHLLHWALHEVVSRDAAQKGSYVGPEKLTFDFSSAALSPEQKRTVEKLVNERIAESAPVSWTEIPYDEAKKRKEIQQFFGEKYGDEVRVVQIGGDPKKLNGYSMELCGGTHVKSTSEIGAFRIVKEEAIAAGTRRIEAVAGDAARVWAKEEAQRQDERFKTLSRKKPDLSPLPNFNDTVQTGEMLKQIDARAAHLEKLDVEVREWEKKHAKEAEADLRSRGAQIANELALSKVGQKICVTKIPDADGKLLQAAADGLRQKFDGPIVLVGAKENNVALVVVVPKQLTSKFQANKIIQQLAPIVGGKGGGRPESAQGGGTDPAKIDDLLAEARRLLS
ncbi:MAG: alanyl-tRNA synthetase, partial [Verrucomicrobiota bacterium]